MTDEGQLPERIEELLRSESSTGTIWRTGNDSVVVRPPVGGINLVEWTRDVGKRIFRETGFIMTGLREHSGGRVEVWFDSVDGVKNPTVAEQAVDVINDFRGDGIDVEPNISDNDKAQFVDIWVTDEESSTLRIHFSLSRDIAERLLDDDIVPCGFAAYDDDAPKPNYRVWFQKVDGTT